MNIRDRERSLSDVYKARIDLGGKMIGAADGEGTMEILGWIFTGGYLGAIAIGKKAAYILLSVIQRQGNGMGVPCPQERLLCQFTV